MAHIQIPEKCGVILLPQTVLFPHGVLPLHIFEPRYRQMLDEALEADWLFCVGNLHGHEEEGFEKAAAPVGTVGLIRTSRLADSGTSNLLLHGISRVHFKEWLDEKPYPLARIEPVLNTTLDAAEERDYIHRLRKAVDKALSSFPQPVKTQVEEILDQSPNPGLLTDAMAHQFIHDPSDRQALLNTPEIRKRFDFLIRFLESANNS